MPLLLTAAHYSATGLREHNEDFAGLVSTTGPEISAKGMIAAIADGVSGSGGGREAAEYCVLGLLADYAAMPESLPVTEALDSAIKAINSKLQRQGHGRIASTLTALVVRDKTYYFAHVGDSRLYQLRGGALQQLTTDHVHDDPELRHVLQRAIGLDAEVAIDHGCGAVEPGDLFLLASDGIWGSLTESDIEWHLSTLAEDPPNPDYTAKLLVDAALASGAKDNATALVVRVFQRPPEAWQALPQRDPLKLWKIIGAVSLAVNLLLLFLLAGR